MNITKNLNINMKILIFLLNNFFLTRYVYSVRKLCYCSRTDILERINRNNTIASRKGKRYLVVRDNKKNKKNVRKKKEKQIPMIGTEERKRIYYTNDIIVFAVVLSMATLSFLCFFHLV